MGALISLSFCERPAGLFSGCCGSGANSMEDDDLQEIDLRRTRRRAGESVEKVVVLSGPRPFILHPDGEFAEQGLWVINRHQIIVAAHRSKKGCFLSSRGDLRGKRLNQLPFDLRLVFLALFQAAYEEGEAVELQVMSASSAFLISAHSLLDKNEKVMAVAVASRPQPDLPLDFSRFVLPDARKRATSDAPSVSVESETAAE